MAIEKTKIVNLEDAQVLYNDLSKRIKDIVAPKYEELTFPVAAGKHCLHDGKVYYAKQNIATTEAWTAAHWQETNLGDEIASKTENQIKDDAAITDQKHTWSVKKIVEETGGAVHYDKTQDLTDAQKSAARQNIDAAKASDILSLVESVTESEGIITITKKNGSTSTITLPQGLAFDGGYVDPEDNTLHLTIGGEDIEGYEPIELPVGGPAGVEYDSSFYLHFYDSEGEEMYGGPFFIQGGGGGGGGSSISLTDVQKATTIRNGANAVFSFTASSSDDTDITVQWYVDGILVSTQGPTISGATFQFNAGPYLKPSDTSIVRIDVISEGGGSLNRRWNVTSTPFALSWGAAIDPITLYTANENVYAVINVSAQAGTENTVAVSIGSHIVERTVTGSRSITVELDKSWFEVGTNIISAVMISGTDLSDTSDEISYVAIWGYGATDPIVCFAESAVTGTQYDTIPIRYFAYKPGSETASCTIQVGDDEPRAVTADRTMRTFNYVYSEDMSQAIQRTVTLTCDESTAEMTLTINKSAYNIGMITGDALRYILDPVGHSNTDADREQFGNLTFSSGFDWVNGGFKTDENGTAAFVVKKGHRVTMPRSLFADNDANGKVMDVSFKIANSDQYDCVAMQDLNNSVTKGLILKANEGELRLDNVAGQVFRYCEDSRIDLSVHVEEITDQRLVSIWLDGIPSKVDAYEAGTLVHSENAMVIGSDHCDVWVYMIRIYNSVLSETEMIQNYISLGSTTSEKVDRYVKNNIFNANNKITPAALHAAIPELTIIEMECSRMTTSKKDNVPANITITDGTTRLELPAATGPDTKDGAVFKVQGTSSAAYGRSSYNMDLDFKGTGKKYKISENSIPVNYLNIKVNVASSENANNVNAVDWYNTYQPYKIEADDMPGVRDTIEAKPCAVFITNSNSSAVWFSSQLVQPGETILYAMGDLCNSKKNLAVFGEDGEGEHPTKACVEVSGNDTQPERFLTDQGFEYRSSEGAWQTYDGLDDQGKEKWITHYEWRMEPDSEDEDEVVEAWEDAVSWLVSTIGDSEKFKEEVEDYFAIDSLLYHFLMLEFFAAYDNVSKNTFYSYDYDADAGKYLWNIKKAYDWDTILAADNDGKPFGDYGLDYGDTIDGTVQGRSYFNAVDNTIWVNLKDAFQSELSAMYISLRSRGAWDAMGVLEKWDTYQAKRPHAAMVHDAYIKYIYPYKTSGMIIDGETKGHDDSYLPRLQGSKTYWRRQFLTYQQAYMDGKYGYYSTSNAIAFRTNCESGRKDFIVKCYAKTFITALADANKVASLKIGTGGTATFENVSVGSNTTIYFTPARLIQYIRPLNETDNSTFVASGATKLMEAILGSEDTNSAWLSGTGLNIPSAILKDLSIRNMENFSSALNLSGNVELETLDTRGTNTGRVTLPSYGPLETLKLNAITGIVALNLDDIEEFSMESGENLISVRAENCSSLIMDAMQEYLEDASSSIQYLRMIGVNWILDNTTLLNKLLTVGSISDAGVTGNPPCVLTGSVYVDSIRDRELTAYNTAWPDLTITYRELITQYTVTFLNWDDSPVLDTDGNPYIQYVDAGGSAHDPIVSEEVNTPTRPSDEQYIYTFDDWDELPTGIIGNETVHATYDTDNVEYVVQWYDGIGVGDGTLIEQKSGLVYGGTTKPTNPFPTYTQSEGVNVYYVFNGWDKSTAFIKPEEDSDTPYTIKVHARWIMGNLPSVNSNPGLALMNWAQRSAVAKNAVAGTYWDPGETMEFMLGHGDDYEYDNVESDVLIEESTWFDGESSPMIFNGQGDLPLLQLFNGGLDRWTLAIDYEAVGDSGAIASCFNDNGNQGFALRRSGNYSNLLWGSENVNVGYKYQRGMVVIRYNRGQYPLVLYVAHDGNLVADEYPINTAKPETNVVTDARARSVATETAAPLTFGGVGSLDGSDVSAMRCAGWIHWAKIWYDDIGKDAAESICAMPHMPFKCMFTEIRYRESLDTTSLVSAGFQSCGNLYLRGRINQTGTNVGGWDACHRREWLNGQFFEGLPIPLQAIIVEARVKATEGGGSSSSHALNILSSMDKVYLPAYAEQFASVTGNNSDNQAYVDECDDSAHRIPGFVYDSTKGQTTDNQTRIRWPGITLPDDTNYCVTGSDPTTAGLGYTVHSGKTVWVNTSNSSNGWLYIDAETAAKHKWYAGRLLSDTTNVKNAVGADSDGKTGGKWILANFWWSRSPYVTNAANFWSVTTYGGGNGYGAYSTYGLAPAFSI